MSSLRSLYSTQMKYRLRISSSTEGSTFCAQWTVIEEVRATASKYTEEYLCGAHKNVVAMLKRIGIQNAVMIQGFCDEGRFRFVDPCFPSLELCRILPLMRAEHISPIRGP